MRRRPSWMFYGERDEKFPWQENTISKTYSDSSDEGENNQQSRYEYGTGTFESRSKIIRRPNLQILNASTTTGSSRMHGQCTVNNVLHTPLSTNHQPTFHLSSADSNSRSEQFGNGAHNSMGVLWSLFYKIQIVVVDPITKLQLSKT